MEIRKCETNDTSQGSVGIPGPCTSKQNILGLHVVEGKLWLVERMVVRRWSPREEACEEIDWYRILH